MGTNKTEVLDQRNNVIERVSKEEYFCKCAMDGLNM